MSSPEGCAITVNPLSANAGFSSDFILNSFTIARSFLSSTFKISYASS
jgi:hypothetical protein